VNEETKAAAPRSSQLTDSAARMRRYRKRKRSGLRFVPLEIREKEIDALIRRGFLVEEDRDQNSAIRRAIYRHLDATLSKV